MILRVTVRNLYSFNKETEISFVAGKSTSHNEQVCRAQKRDDISILKAGLIYGANASGKSNMIKAIALIQRIATRGIPQKNIEPFKLEEPNNLPSKIELEFKVGKRNFAYGVEFTIRGILEEWFYEINDRKDKMIYTRKVVNGENKFEFGTINGNADTHQFVRFVSQGTTLKDSFLSEYVKRNGKGLNVIVEAYIWLSENLKILFPESRYRGISIRAEQDKEFAKATKSLLSYFNTGIVDVCRMKISKEEVDLPRNLIDKFISEAKPNERVMIASDFGESFYMFEADKDGVNVLIYKQKTIHKLMNGKEVYFEMNEESDGSIRLLDFMPMLIDLRLNDCVYLVDEIDRSMHPMLSRKLLEYYLHHLEDERKTQLIFTTHESNLLDLNVIRADEVWFVEKGKDGASYLTSLAEYKPREDVRKGYLQGRYGAIPFFAPIKSLKW